ncbi:helix-turn-helix transcriptional regulator [Thalassiella azotivora]
MVGAPDRTGDADASVLERLGLGAEAAVVYAAALSRPDTPPEQLSAATGLQAEDVGRAVDELERLGLGAVEPSGFVVAPPHSAIDALISRRQDELAQAARLLEESRENVGEVLDAYLERFRREVTSGVELLEGVEAVQALVRRMAETAVSSVLTVLPRVPAAAGVRDSLDADRLAMRRGVEIRTVVPAAVGSDAEVLGLLTERVRHGARVRVHPRPPLQCVLVDDACAVLPCDPASVRVGAWVVRDNGLLHPVRLLLADLWAAGVPVELPTDEPAAGGEDAADGARVREVFRLLAQGLKDDSVARRLDTSVRTVRRLVAEGMRVLGADSRFEAGVLAQRRGWFDGNGT